MKQLLLTFLIATTLLLSGLFSYSQTVKTTYDFSTAAAISGYVPTTWPWYTQADITIDGTAYKLTCGGNGSFTNATSGGSANSKCLRKDGSGGDSFTLQRTDGLPFQFYGIWINHQSMNQYVSFGYSLPPWYTLTAQGYSYQDMTTRTAGTTPSDYTYSTQTISPGINGVTTTSVSISFQAIIYFSIDDIIVGPVPPAAPSVSSVSVPANGTYKTNGNLDFTANFSEAITVTGSPYIPITLNTGGTVNAAYVSGSGTTALVFRYIVASGNLDNDGISVGTAITANGGTLKNTSSTNANLTLNSIASTTNVKVDAVAPTASIVLADNALNVGETSLVTVTFSEAVTGFTNADLTIANGTLSSVSSSDGGATWTATLTPTASVEGATNVITLNNTGISDASGNAGSGTTNSNNYAIDTQRPTSSIVVADNALKAGETSLVTVTFSEAVTGFTNADLNIANGTLSAVSSGDGGVTWSATFTPTGSIEDATNVITLDNTGVSDASGNTGAGTTNSNNYAIDTKRPTSSIVVADNALNIRETSLVTITFSEAVTGFTNADLTIANGTLSSVSSSDGGVTWTATLTPTASVEGATNVITLNNTGISDASGNAGSGTTDSNNYAIDAYPPTVINVTSSTPNGIYKTSDVIAILVTYSEAVTVTGNPTLSLNSGGSASYTSGTATSTLTFNYTVGSGQSSTDLDYSAINSLALAGGTIKDAAGNNATLTLPTVSGASSLGGLRNIVIKAEQTITFEALPTKTYGDIDFNPPATASSGLTVSYTTSDSNVATIVGGQIHIVGMGNCTIYANQNGNATYLAAAQASQTFTVNKATLTATADAKTKEYGDVNPNLTFVYSGWKNSDDETVLDIIPTPSTTVTQLSDVGTYTNSITVSGGADNNYDFNYVAANFVVIKATLTATADAKTKVYGDVNPNLTFVYSGWKDSDDETVLDIKPTPSTTVNQLSDVGTYTNSITVSSGADNNYDFNYVAANFVVTKATLTATADAKIKVYGDVNPNLTFVYSGWKNGDNETVLDTKPLAGTTVTNTTSVGVHANSITVSGGLDNNYLFSYVTANFNVSKAMLLIHANASNKVYDGSNKATVTGGQLVGILNNDIVTLTLGSATFDNKLVETNKVVTVAGSTISGTAAGNYSLTEVSGLSANITPKQLTIASTSVVKNKIFNNNTTALIENIGTLQGIESDDLNSVNASAIANYNNKNAGTDKTIIVVYSLTGSASSNYAKPVDYTVSNGEIVAKQLTISNPIITTNKMYDGTTTAMVLSVGVLSGVEDTDANNVSITAGANYNDAKAGTAKTISVVYTLSGSAAGNYLAPASLQINNAKISEKVVLNTLQQPTAGCEDSDLVLNYTVSAGTPVQYQITFADNTRAAGFQDISFTDLTSSGNIGVVAIPVPSGILYGTYQASLQVRNELGMVSEIYPFQFVVNVSSDFIIPKFDDVVLCDNKTNSFSSFQWYKNGKAIAGATRQFYNDTEGLIGTYSLKLKTIGGQELFTCSRLLNIPKAKKVSVGVYPNPMKTNQASTVKITGMSDEELEGAVMSVYNIQGIKVYSTKKIEQSNTLILQNLDGSYVGHIITAKGNDYVFRILLVK